MLALRAALRLAIGGEFDAEVRAAISQLSGVVAVHDMRRPIVGGQPIDHLVVAPAGVFVVDSVVCSAKVSYDSEGVLIDKGRHRGRDPMVDHVAQETAAVADLAKPVPARGLIVFRDLLSLPSEIRAGRVTIKGVQLLTLPLLASVLEEAGSVSEVETVLERLRDSFEVAVPSPSDELRLERLHELAGDH